MTTAQADWYDDPSMPGQMRWWDGSAWTDHTKASTAQEAGPDTVPFAPGQELGGEQTQLYGPITQKYDLSQEREAPPIQSQAPDRNRGQNPQHHGSVQVQAPQPAGPMPQSAGSPPQFASAAPQSAGSPPQFASAAPQSAGPPPQFASAAPQSAGPPPQFASAAPQSAGPPPQYGGVRSGINDFGTWFGRSFSMPFRRIVPLAGIFFVQTICWPTAWMLLDLGLGDAVIDDNGLRGVQPAALVAAPAVAFLGILLFLLGLLASAHNLYTGWIGRPAGFGRSMAMGLTMLPRFVFYWFLATLGLGVMFVIPVVVASLAQSVVGDSAALLIFLLLGLGAFVGWVYLAVRIGTFPIAAAVAPMGRSPLAAAWSASKGFFWGLFGRLLLLNVVVGVIVQVVWTLIPFVGLPAIATTVSFGPEEELLINGVDFFGDEVVELGALMPNPVPVAVFIFVFVFANFIVAAINQAGYAGLYADLGGANRYGHQRLSR